MSKQHRRILTALLAAFHAAVMLLGPCLHGALGGEHESGFSSKVAPALGAEKSLKLLSDKGDDCPICHFLAQGQNPSDRICWSEVLSTTYFDDSHVDATSKTFEHGASAPRAPPQINRGQG